jgi:hypothetical protein
MSETKYKTISSTIENSIKSNVYGEKLPPVRTLAAEFEVSTRTINKALKELVTKGLIIPRGPKGIIIPSLDVIRPRTNIVSIFCNTSALHPNSDPMLKELKLKIEDDGYKPIFMNAPDPTAFDDENFWSSNWVDGYIFAYSTINKELAYKLHNKNVPFVVANRLPSECGAHWVEFNLKQTLKNLIEILIAKGRTRIMFAYSRVKLPSYLDFIMNIWREIVNEYSDECSGISIHLDSNNYEENDLKCAERFFELGVNGLISIGLSPLAVEAALSKKGLVLNRDYSIVYRSPKIVAPVKDYPCAMIPYKNLADEVWTLFKKVIENPGLETQNILVDENIFIDGIKNWKYKLDFKETFSSKVCAAIED